MGEIIDLIIALVFIILFIFYLETVTRGNHEPSEKNESLEIDKSLEKNKSSEKHKSTNNNQSEPTHHHDKKIPYLRGILHIALSLILPIVYAFMPEPNLSIESMILCCTFSGMYHRLTPYIPRYTSTFRLMDYLGIDMVILSYPMILFQRHNDTSWTNRMPLVVATMFIAEFILFHYHYHINPLGDMDRMQVHILCLIFGMYHVIMYGDYMSPWCLFMLSLYFMAFYVFSTMNTGEPVNHTWSQHETFHLVLLFAFIVHIYISTKNQ